MSEQAGEGELGGEQPSGLPGGGSKKNLYLVGALVVVLLLLAGLWVFGRDGAVEEEVGPKAGEEAMGEDELEPAVSEGEATEVSEGEVKEFAVSGTSFKFTPAEIRVQRGDTVRITFTNDSTMPHDWRVDEFQAATSVNQAGQQDTVEFIADQAGRFEYYCSVGQHRQQGMVGTLIVE